MTLSAGSRLGAYEILAPLGAGGMGEVYRARDTRLSREVAIKVLPSAVASDPDRRLRFEQEARSASALNHPNILTIYDVGSSDGTVYIAMELIEGKTLRELISGGEPLPMRRLLDVATQTAEGLAKAHGAGIVHRDLKPENLMVSKDGFVKILDFGLAKLIEPVTQEQSALPTAVAAPTTPGTVMGTAGYMSPEQASGQPVDYRSDQFTLGAILYEMATGKRAFQRKTGAETLVAIIREEPEPISQVAPRAPAPVRWIVERLLAKDPEERYASTKDLARDLKAVRDHLSETSASGALEPAERVRGKRRGWVLRAALALLVGAAAGVFLRDALRRAPRPVQFQRLTFQRGRLLAARFAPDRQTIVYDGAWEGGPLDIFSTRVDGTASRSLGLTGAGLLSVSTQGELAVALGRHYTVGYQSTGTLARVPLAGGAPREIIDGVQDADWSPDGKELAVCRVVGNRSRLEYPIGKVLYSPPGWVSGVRLSRDGRWLAFVDHPQGGNADGYVKVMDASTGKVRVTGPFTSIFGNAALAWSPKDEVLFGGIQAMSLGGRIREVWASPTGILQDVSPDGRTLVVERTGRREIVGVSPDGTARNLTWLDWSFPTDISSDTVLFNEQNSNPLATFVRPLDGAPAVRIADGEGTGLSPDGRWAATVALPERHVIRIVPVGAGETKTVDVGKLTALWLNWFPDGRRLLLCASEPGHGPRLYVLGVAGGPPRPISPEGTTITIQAVSPDGRSVVALGPDGRLTLFPTESGEARPLPGQEHNDYPVRWTADGKGIYVIPRAERSVDVLDVATGRRTEWKKLVAPDPTGVEQMGPVVVSPDGSAYVFSYRRVLGDLYLATGMK